MDFLKVLVCLATISSSCGRPHYMMDSSEERYDGVFPLNHFSFPAFGQPPVTRYNPFKPPSLSHRFYLNTLPSMGYKIHNTVPGAIPLLLPVQRPASRPITRPSTRPLSYISNDIISPTFLSTNFDSSDSFEFDDWSDNYISTIRRPTFSPFRDTQVFRKPSNGQQILKDSVKPNNNILQNDVPKSQPIRYAYFPTEIGESFGIRDSGGSDLTLSAPAGIVQSAQPRFSLRPFRNSKASHHLDEAYSEQIPRVVDPNNPNYPKIIEV